MQVEHSGGVKAMTDEQLEQSLAVLKELIAQRDAGASAKVIEGKARRIKTPDVVADGDIPPST
jgi:GTPase